jgi:hypothetical protein
LLALGALAPLAAFLFYERRSRRVRRTLALEAPGPRSLLPTVIAVALIPILLGIALAQPILRSTREVRVRKDAEVFYTFDTSTSMAAAAKRGGATRLDRSLRAALRMQLALGDLRSGVATMTDRVLPDLFPTADSQVFTATLDESVGINRPPPRGFAPRATTFAALDTFAGTNFFDPGIKHRVVVLFTDGETGPYFPDELRGALRGPPFTDLVVIHLWHANERLYTSSGIDRGYRPDPSSARDVATLATLLHGHAYGEGSIGAAISEVRRIVGKGPVEPVGRGLRVIPLARWFVIAALVPLAFLLWRRFPS